MRVFVGHQDVFLFLPPDQRVHIELFEGFQVENLPDILVLIDEFCEDLQRFIMVFADVIEEGFVCLVFGDCGHKIVFHRCRVGYFELLSNFYYNIENSY